MKNNREKISLATAKDFDVSYFCGSGAGGQARNKVASGVQIIHRESGAMGRASDSRSQAQNKKSAFERLTKTPKMKWWIEQKLYEIRENETLEETIERETTDENLKFEIKDSDGKWKEVDKNYFDTAEAKKEIE